MCVCIWLTNRTVILSDKRDTWQLNIYKYRYIFLKAMTKSERLSAILDSFLIYMCHFCKEGEKYD